MLQAISRTAGPLYSGLEGYPRLSMFIGVDLAVDPAARIKWSRLGPEDRVDIASRERDHSRRALISRLTPSAAPRVA